jgi:hypothetical protein
MILIAHRSQPNELQRIKIDVYMVCFSGFPWNHCTSYSDTIWDLCEILSKKDNQEFKGEFGFSLNSLGVMEKDIKGTKDI